jgi:biotin-(acetyl-CoA carboxylase) ligase
VNGTSGVAAMIDREGRLEIAVGHGEVVIVESGEVVYER